MKAALDRLKRTAPQALRRGVCAAVIGGLGAGQALAATDGDHPRLAPMRDVTVVYRLSPQTVGAVGAGKDVKVAFSGSGDLVRIDSADGQGVTILDRPHNVVTLIMLEQHLYTQLHAKQGLHNPFLLDLSMTYTRTGHDVIAGVPCVSWDVSNTHGKAQACVTDDGVILSENGVDADGAEGSIRAVSVTYKDLPSATFAPPDGFHRLSAKPHAPGTSSAVAPPPSAPLVDGNGTVVPNVEGGEPPVSNDSVTDGTVSQPDQPPSLSGSAPEGGPSPSVGGGQ
ncbi:hypothetical protein [Neokomagataea thailandica]|uniref:DUF4412 domain-containing protein n=1 Tax=Neokomagataea tanensis NBRC 106556 TaxID=1223519 RepID=A0ABQ0QLJ1_9PROT|nr:MULTISPECIES: hypothetical protein [Neokomagataea]GBR49360.1 hypothetical protein AA106556_2023 [Neokomagataea tanensis NBRC 106556]